MNADNYLNRNVFAQLVGVSFIKHFILSVTGMIDTALVGNYISTEALSAMSLAMPVFSIIDLISSVLGSGQSIIVSREISSGHKEVAEKTINSVFSLMIIISLVSTLTGIFAPEILTYVFTGRNCDPVVFDHTTDYLKAILIGTLPILMYEVLSTVILFEGARKHLAIASGVLLITDIIGDIIAIRIGAGILGISVASVFAYLCAFMVVGLYFVSKGSMFSLKLIIPDFKSLKEVISSGLPTAVSYICNILWPISINSLMLRFGNIKALAALSIQDALHYVPDALCSGIANAAMILTGIYSSEYDEKSLKELRTTILSWSIIGGLVSMVIMRLLSGNLLPLFSDDQRVLELASESLSYYLVSVPFYAINKATFYYFQGRQNRKVANAFILINHLVLPVTLAWVWGYKYGESGIFASYLACEVFMFLLLVLVETFMPVRKENTDQKAEYRKLILNDEDAVEASKKIYDICLENGIDQYKAKHIRLCAEELATNSVEHGFTKDNRKHQAEIRTLIRGNEFIMRIRDDCKHFDLKERYKVINPDDLSRNIGLRIIFAEADDVSYSSALNMNNVCIRIRI